MVQPAPELTSVRGRSRKLAIVLAVLLVFTAAAPARAQPPSPSDDCVYCIELSRQLDDPVDRVAALELCHMMFGGLTELTRYRNAFDRDARYIDLFPMVYWHTTNIELQRLHDREFAHPVEELQQLLVFLDAYMVNRDLRKSLGAEPHWRRHFEIAETADDEFGGIGRGMAFDTPDAIDRVLMSGISAHIDYDLPRAIRAAFDQRKLKSLTLAELHGDFLATAQTLKVAGAAGTDELIATARRVSNWEPALLSRAALRSWDRLIMSTDAKVIDMRNRAWEIAVGVGTPPTGNAPSPVTDHRRLEQQGRLSCPAGLRESTASGGSVAP